MQNAQFLAQLKTSPMKTPLKAIVALASFAGLLLGQSAFSANLIVNPGFETGDLTGWAALGTGGSASITVQSPANGPSAPGSFNAYQNNGNEAANLALQQTTPNGSVAGGVLVNYSFDLMAGNNANGGVEFVHIFNQNAMGGVIGEPTGLIGPLLLGPPDGLWHTFSGSFMTLPGTDHLTIEFDAATGAIVGSLEQMHIDNVVLSPVPEPASLSLAAMGLITFLTLRRKR
jgi:hypothetical protein